MSLDISSSRGKVFLMCYPEPLHSRRLMSAAEPAATESRAPADGARSCHGRKRLESVTRSQKTGEES